MSGVADPDEALIEAIAEAIINADPPDGVMPRRTEAWIPEARAAYAAMVAHLGLVEERCCDDPPDDYRFMSCAEFGQDCLTRLAQPWPNRVEVDHGSE